jgi:ribonuclease P protein component
VVRLAVRRNRLKRLLREVVRKEPFFADAGKAYFFRVHALPEDLDLKRVLATVNELIQ